MRESVYVCTVSLCKYGIGGGQSLTLRLHFVELVDVARLAG